jgi:hypothetical protein
LQYKFRGLSCFSLRTFQHARFDHELVWNVFDGLFLFERATLSFLCCEECSLLRGRQYRRSGSLSAAFFPLWLLSCSGGRAGGIGGSGRGSNARRQRWHGDGGGTGRLRTR